jgi:arylsulfatase A-like enzyme
MDGAIGRLLVSLEEEKLRNNTLVIFISDNGGQTAWSPVFEYDMKHGPYDKLGDNAPLRGAKSEVYEGGIRVPAVFNWPGVLSPSKNRDQIMVSDLFPTVASICGINGIDNFELDGINIWPGLAGKEKTANDRTLYLRTNNSIMYRLGDWKLIHHASDLDSADQELFDIANDPLEKQNLIDQKPEMARQLWADMSTQVKMEDSLQILNGENGL